VAAPLATALAAAPTAIAPLWLVSVTGLVAAVVAAGAWAFARVAVTIAHEGGHAFTASAVGAGVAHIEIHREGGGETLPRIRGTDGNRFLYTIAGYIGPPLFGLAGAMLLSTGRVKAALWLSLVLVACALWFAKGWYSIASMSVLGGLIFLVIRYAGVGAQTFFTYTWVWLLLIGGIRGVLVLAEIRATGKDVQSDAYELGQLTSLPATIFVGFFTMASFAALVAGGLIMVGALA
jgi:Peptidase M50B-like